MKSAVRKLLAITLILAITCLQMVAYAVPDDADTEAAGADDPAVVAAEERVDMDPPLWEQCGFGSMQEMMEAYGMESEDEYYELVAMEMMWQQEYTKWREQAIVELGGTLGITNVMVNGQFAKFGAAVPERSGGTVCAPVSPVLALIGASVSFDAASQSVTAKYGGTTIRLSIGGTDMVVTENGKSATADLGVAPYLKGGSAYIPVRAVFEALGCTVYWDVYYETVVVIDKAVVIASFNKDFTILNRLLSMPAATQTGGRKTTLDAELVATMFDTIDGDKDVKATADFTYLTDGRNASLSGTFNASGLLTMIFKELYGDYYYEDEIEAELGDTEKLLKNAKLDAIINADDGVSYIKSPILGIISPRFPADTWIKADGTDLFGEAVSSADDLLGGTTVGELIYGSASGYNTYYDQIHLYEVINSTAKMYAAIVGDSNFKQSGDNYTLTVKEEVGGLFSNLLYGLLGMYDGRGGIEINLTIKTDGSAITAVNGDIMLKVREYGSTLLIDGSIDASASGMALSLEYHVKNSMKLVLDLKTATTAYTGEIPKEPPAGEKVVSMDEIYGIRTETGPVITNM